MERVRGLPSPTWPAHLFHPLPGGGWEAVPSTTDGSHVQGVPAVVDVLSTTGLFREVDDELGRTTLGWVDGTPRVNDAWITRFQGGSECEQAYNQ